MATHGPWIEHFPGNMVWSNACLVTKGMAPCGAVALGEIDEICERLKRREGEYDAWEQEWCAMGARLEKIAEQAAADGRQMTAGDYYLRAGMYYFTGERFVYPGERKREIGRKALACQHAGLKRRYSSIEFVEVPYEGSAPERGAGAPESGGCDREGVREPAGPNTGASTPVPGSHPASGARRRAEEGPLRGDLTPKTRVGPAIDAPWPASRSHPASESLLHVTPAPAQPSAGSLPALFMKAPGVSGRAPTVVVFDGMDNCKEMSVLFNGLEFAARGWHTLAIDGPGQGESLRLRGLYARHDYEVPGKAAYEYVVSRADVDPAKVVVMGYSFGGYYAARVAAFEQRYAAGVAFAALHWDLAGWQREIRRRHETDPKNTAQSAFHFRWVMGHADDADAAIAKAEKFSLAEVAPQITMPFLIVHAEDDKVVPVASAHKLFDAIGSKRKHLKIFTAADGGVYHAQVDNRQVGVDYIADWISANV